MLSMDKENFLRTALGEKLLNCIISWDVAITELKSPATRQEARFYAEKNADWNRAQWEAYKIAILQFYGIEYNFSRTEEYFGLCTGDGSEWLFRVDRDKGEVTVPGNRDRGGQTVDYGFSHMDLVNLEADPGEVEKGAVCWGMEESDGIVTVTPLDGEGKITIHGVHEAEVFKECLMGYFQKG